MDPTTLLSRCEPNSAHCGCSCIVAVAEAIACCVSQHEKCHAEGDQEGCGCCDASLGSLLDAMQAQVDGLRACHKEQQKMTSNIRTGQGGDGAQGKS